MFYNIYKLENIQSILSLIFIFSLHLFGFFIFFPIFFIKNLNINNSNELLIGFSIFLYGFSQILSIIFFKYISNKYGNKNSLILSAILFFIGSIIGFFCTSIYGFLLARFFQGFNSISFYSIKILSELIDYNNRFITMILFVTITGFSFISSIVLSTIIVNFLNFDIIFLFISCCTLFCILSLFFFVPEKKIFLINNSLKKINLFSLIYSPYCLFLLVSICILKYIFITNLFILPIYLKNIGFSYDVHWKIYFFSLSISYVLSFLILKIYRFFIKEKNKFVLLFIFFLFSEFFIYTGWFSKNNIILILQIFFIFFNILEFYLLYLIHYFFPIDCRSFFMKVYLIIQSLGISLGGLIGGFLFYNFSINFLLIVNIIVLFFWTLFSFYFLKINKNNFYI